jgi:hypothetical protein
VAYVMTYSSLLVDVRRYLERGFTEASDPIVYDQLPRLVALAERRIAHELKLQGFIRAVTTTLAANTAVIQKPDRWRDTVSVKLQGVPVLSRSFEYLRNYWPDETETGTPEFYADYDYQHWVFAPTPAVDTDLEILYYELPRPIDEENQTNWLTTYAPNLILYATLLEATPFLKNDERVTTWQSMYDRFAQALSGEDMGKVMDRTATRSEV